MLTPLIVGNWKMHHGIADSAEFLQTLSAAELPSNREIVVCPPFTLLPSFRDGHVLFGAQNMHWETHGAFTGEISPTMLKELGCSYVIIGHSERRQYNNETDTTVHQKVQSALQHGLKPIICVGSRSEDEAIIKQHLHTQLRSALQGVAISGDLVVAYEPIWAIGTGKTATPEHAQTIHAMIRLMVGNQVRILYGGSVNATNAKTLLSQPDVNGLLVGGASLDVTNFLKIIQS